MSKLCLEILDAERLAIFYSLKKLPRGGVLGGGTALALQMGHRQSYDFDIFYPDKIKKTHLDSVRKIFGKRISAVLVDTSDELTVSIDGEIKITLLYYPFKPLHAVVRPEQSIPLLSLRDGAANKAYTVGRRGVWRDYVDVFFVLRDHLSLATVIADATKKFDGVFSEKLFLEQLVYFADITSYQIEFIEDSISTSDIKKFFITEVRGYTKK